MSLGPGLGLGTQRGWGDRTKHPRVPCCTSSCLQEGSGGPSLPLIVCLPLSPVYLHPLVAQGGACTGVAEER